MSTSVKICGLSTPETLAAALDAGADMVGLVFFEKSPRHVGLEPARALAAQARHRAEIVALTVDAGRRRRWRRSCAGSGRIISSSTAARAPSGWRRSRRNSAFPSSRRSASPKPPISRWPTPTRAADALLIDAKPPKGAVLPGGNGVAFDWRLARDFHPRKPWLLSGGLTPENVGEAIRDSLARAVDVSSGVESAPGLKDAAKIRAFVAAARAGFEAAEQE